MNRAELERKLLELAEGEKKKLRAYFRRHLPVDEDPLDAIQETFTTAFLKSGELEENSKLVPWLWGVAANVANNLRRANRTRARHTAAQEARDSSDEPAPPAATEERERKARLRAALDALPDEERMAIELNVFGGLAQSEIADALGWPIAKVKNRAKAGHEKLAVALKGLDL